MLHSMIMQWQADGNSLTLQFKIVQQKYGKHKYVH